MAKYSDNLISLLMDKRRKDPEGFRKYLPDVADMLPGTIATLNLQLTLRPDRKGTRLSSRWAERDAGPP